MPRLSHWVRSRRNALSFWVPAIVLVCVAYYVASLLDLSRYYEIEDQCEFSVYMQYAAATERLHEAAMTVGSVLAAFTMMVAYTANTARKSRKETAFFCLVSFSSVAFVCAVCASGLSLFAYRTLEELAEDSFKYGAVMWNLTALAASAGLLGVIAFLAGFGLNGYLSGTARGRFTAVLALLALTFMVGASLQVLQFVNL